MKANPFYHLGANHTVDIVIINPMNEVLMIKRSSTSDACPSMLALPGGFINTEASKGEEWKGGLEKPEDAALRELAEETNLTLPSTIKLTPVGIYEGNHRDPRDNQISWSKSHAFLYPMDQKLYDLQKDHIRGMDDADEARWIKITELEKIELAFDHNKILSDALKLLK